MRCDVCNTDVIDNENVEEVKRSKDQMNRLLEQTSTIVNGLKTTESIRLPAWVTNSLSAVYNIFC